MRGTRSSTYLKADGLEEEVGGEEVEVPAEAADEGGEVVGESGDDSKHFGSFRRVPEQDGVACSFTSTVSNLAESSNPLALLTPPERLGASTVPPIAAPQGQFRNSPRGKIPRRTTHIRGHSPMRESEPRTPPRNPQA